jgi:hypothetical protein
MFTSEIEQSLHFETFENKFSLKYILLTRYDIIYQLISQYELVKRFTDIV